MRRNEDNKDRRFFTSRTFLIIALIIAIGIAFSFARAYYQNYKVKKEIEQLELEVRKLEAKKLESMQIFKYVASQNFIEEKARTELNLKKPGEHAAVMNNDKREYQEKIEPARAEKKLLYNPVKWWYYFTTGIDPDGADKK